MDTSTIVGTSRRSQRQELRPEKGFSALGDPSRLAILRALSSETRCECELGPQLGISQNLLSYHLRVLREAGLVRGTKRGRRIEYRTRPAALQTLALELIHLAVGGEERED